MWWFCPTWPKRAFGDQKCLIRNKDMPFRNLPHHWTEIAGVLKTIFIFFYPFMGQKVVFWVKKAVFLRKSAIFQSMIRGTAKRHGFLHIGAHLATKGALGQIGQIHLISTCIQGKSAIFSKYGFSLQPKLDYV